MWYDEQYYCVWFQFFLSWAKNASRGHSLLVMCSQFLKILLYISRYKQGALRYKGKKVPNWLINILPCFLFPPDTVFILVQFVPSFQSSWNVSLISEWEMACSLFSAHYFHFFWGGAFFLTSCVLKLLCTTVMSRRGTLIIHCSGGVKFLSVEASKEALLWIITQVRTTSACL